MDARERAISTVLVDCLGVSEGETLVVVSDPPRRTIAELLTEGGRALGAEVVWMEMSERENNGVDPPAPIAAAMLEADVIVCPTTKSMSHTPARKAATQKGIRAATMPQITEDMLVRTMSADYSEVRRRSDVLAKALTEGSEVRITSADGTDVTLAIDGRDGWSDGGDITKPGAFGNLPAGEGFIAPVEGKTQGRIVFDGSIWPVGRLSSPLTAVIENGYAVDFTGEAAEDFKRSLEPYGKEAFNVAELGIGTNEAATLTGNILEDEKILGTIHVAFGDNHSFGGTVRVPSHSDGVVLKPSLTIDGQTFVDAGKLLV